MDIKKAIRALEDKRYIVSFFENSEDAQVYLNGQICNRTVGLGDSITIASMRLYESLSTHNWVQDPQHSKDGLTFEEVAKKCLTTDVFLTSVNAFAETGELVNIDGTGNRIAGSVFGHQKVYIIVGTNKLVPTLEDAVWRARNIAAPRNAMRFGLNTPCAKNAERCFDCKSSDRCCNAIIVHLNKMYDMEMEIVIINEKLGL